MATQRYISTGFWDDPWVQTLDPAEKFVYLYLMTNPLTNLAGVYEITIKRICFDTGYNTETIQKVLKRFEEAKKIYRWKNHIILRTWPKHQKWQKRSKIKAGIVAILEELDEELLGYLKSIGYTYPIDTLSIPYTYDPNYSDLNADLNSDADSNAETDTVSKPLPVDNSVTPKAVQSAAAAVLDLHLKQEDAETVSEGLTAYEVDIGFIEWAAGELKKRRDIKNPAGFLRKMLLGIGDYADWTERYRKSPRASPHQVRPDPPADKCPDCGGPMRIVGDEAWCPSCKRLIWEYDWKAGIWREPGDIKTA